MHEMRSRLTPPLLVGVGAAFDFHAGLVSQAPAVDAAQWPGVGLPPLARATPAVAALRALQPAASSPASRGSTHAIGAPAQRPAATGRE